jgi:hypothetical protein
MLGSSGYITSTLCISVLEWLTTCLDGSISYGFGGIIVKLLDPEGWVVLSGGYAEYPFLPCATTTLLDFWILQMYFGAATSSQFLLRAENTLIMDALGANQHVLAIPKIGINTTWGSEWNISFVIASILVHDCRFADRDMAMRYHWGYGVGHTYARRNQNMETSSQTQTDQSMSDSDMQDDNRASLPKSMIFIDKDDSELGSNTSNGVDHQAHSDIRTSDMDSCGLHNLLMQSISNSETARRRSY